MRVLLRVSNLKRWLVAPAVRNAHPSSPNSCSSRSRDLLPLVASSHVVTRTWSGDFVPAVGLSWPLRVLLQDLARPRERHPAPRPLSALPRDSSGPASTHRAGPSSRDLPPSPVPVLALLLRTWRPAPSVASTIRSPSDRPHNRIAILQPDPVSLSIYERTHIDLVLLQSIAHLRSSSATATAIVSAWTSKPTNFILFTDRLLSLVALRFGLTDSQRNPRAANRSRSFHGDNQDFGC